MGRMTNEEASKVIEEYCDNGTHDFVHDALQMAIRALEKISEWTTWSKTYENMVIDAIRNADVCVAWNGYISPEDAAHIAIICTKGSVIESIKQLPPTQPDLQPTCNQLATDCISRQAAIDTLMQEVRLVDGYYCENDEVIDKDDALDAIKALPSVQPEIIHCRDCKWCDERHRVYDCHNPVLGDGYGNYPPPCLGEDGFCSRAERKET